MSETERTRSIVKLMREMIPIVAISPASGGDGEAKRADYLESVIREMGLRPRRYTYVDKWGKKRPSLVVKHGKCRNTIWIVGHIDTVASGDPGSWKTDPFRVSVRGDRIYGRGTEDNGQGVAAGVIALRELVQSGAVLSHNYGLILAADEESGSQYGMQRLMGERIFKSGDMFLVPDGGSESGDELEIAEKGIMWLKFTVHGKQTHGSMPNKGVNASRLSSELSVSLDRMLHSKYARRNRRFEPDVSTFEITKREQNVASINIIPGKDVFYMDTRILPEYTTDEVLSSIKAHIRKCRIKADVEVVQSGSATTTNVARSKIVSLLSRAVREELRVKPRLIGIGGGTVAAFPRQAGFDAVVWAKEAGMMHKANEYVRISSIEEEIEVIKRLYR